MTQQAPRYIALIPAAGVGSRMGAATPKQYMEIAGQPMLRRTVDAFLSCDRIAHTFVVVSQEDGYIDGVLPDGGVTVLRCGGATRMESIRNGLDAVRAQLRDDDHVLVHDAARPGLTARLIEKLIAEVGDHPAGGLLALPVVDTVKRSSDRLETIPREDLWLAQTPQMFSYRLLREALAACAPGAVTDDASAVEALGYSPRLVEGHPRNLKVTLPSDIRIAEMYLASPDD